ncbi:hypothetical protein IW262DRAFT_1466136 [Armillaria fumosa]|nr:hypothetical protein IW262DRAFT_1466136 [Armillaria fumosa]
MVCDQDSALGKAQLRVYFHLRLSSFKAFLQFVSVQEIPPRKFPVDMARRGPPYPPLKFRCDYRDGVKRCEWSFKTEHGLHRHQLIHLEGDAREEHLYYCRLGTGCPLRFKNLQLPNLRAHIKTVHRDIEHLICQVCKPFMFIADPVAFTQHQAEAHDSPQSTTSIPRITPIPTAPASSSWVISQSKTPERITLVPLETLPRTQPTPITPRHPTSFIVRTIPPLPESLDLEALHPPYCSDWDVAPEDDNTHSSAIPTLREFLWEMCGIELIPAQWAYLPIHRHLSASPTSSTGSEPTISGSSSSSLSATVFPSPISEPTTSATTLQSLGSLSTPNLTNNT